MRKGFTLIELSIVIVVVGLLTAAVLVGVNLTKNAAVNRVMREFQQYEIAAHQFRKVYRYWPGDISNASTYFTTGCATNCNGNGNGLSGDADVETVRFFHHLQLAGMINTQFSTSFGTATEEDYRAWSKSVIPNASINTGGMMFDATTHNMQSEVSDCPAALRLGIWAAGPAPGWPWRDFYRGGALKPSQAAALDNKTDDGKPNTGHNLAVSASGTCVSSGGTGYFGTDGTRNYELSESTQSCMVFYCLNKKGPQ